MTPSAPVHLLTDPDRTRVLLKEPRRRILELASEPVSAVELAHQLDAPRQRIGYHVRELVRAGLLEEVDENRRGAMVEKRFRANAEAYALSPDLLGGLSADVDAGDAASLAHLLGALHQVQRDVGSALERTRNQEARIPTLTLSSRIRFRDAAQRGAFARALADALTQVVARHSEPYEPEPTPPGEESAPACDPFRLTLTLNPIDP